MENILLNSQNIIVFSQLLKFWSVFPVGFEDFLREIPALPRGEKRPAYILRKTFGFGDFFFIFRWLKNAPEGVQRKKYKKPYILVSLSLLIPNYFLVS